MKKPKVKLKKQSQKSNTLKEKHHQWQRKLHIQRSVIKRSLKIFYNQNQNSSIRNGETQTAIN
jgi:hypothetical protein